MTKKCSKCGVRRLLKFFNKDRRYRLGVTGWCKRCFIAYSRLPHVVQKGKERWAKYMSDPKNRAYERQRSRLKSNPRQQRDATLRRTLGISLKKFEISKRCCLCRKGNRRLCADHNHRTGKYRGALCVTCNTMLAKFERYPKLLKRLLQYLRRG